jgi:hypothetical protein
MADRSQHPGQIMEAQTRYDLNAAVESWRAELAAQPNLTAEVRRELETHLRDAIAGFQQRGLNNEESFWLACKRVGQPPQLGEEFVKADPAAFWRERVFWMAFAYVLFDLWKSLTSDLFSFVTSLAVKNYSISILHGMGYPIIFSCYSMLSILLVVWFSFSLAQGGTHKWRFSIGFIFKSRIRFFFTFLTLSFAACFLGMVNIWPGSLSLSITRSGFINILCILFFEQSGLPLALVAVSAWLMPTQNLKTPKRA